MFRMILIFLKSLGTNEMTSPTPIAIVRSAKIVNKKVENKMIISKAEPLIIDLKDRHSLILKATTIKIPARQDMGINFAHLPNKSIINSSVIEWTIPEIGVRPPIFTLVAVLAIAPVAGIPPKKGVTILATPCAISSVLDLWFPSIILSETTAESKDSILPNRAMVMAGPI